MGLEAFPKARSWFMGAACTALLFVAPRPAHADSQIVPDRPDLTDSPTTVSRGADDDTGPGDLLVALKYRFLDARDGSWWPSLGVRPFVKLPVARTPIGSDPEASATPAARSR